MWPAAASARLNSAHTTPPRVHWSARGCQVAWLAWPGTLNTDVQESPPVVLRARRLLPAAPPASRRVQVCPAAVARVVPFPTAKPFWGPTIWRSPRLPGGGRSSGPRAVCGQAVGGLVDDVVAGAVVDVVVVRSAVVSFEP